MRDLEPVGAEVQRQGDHGLELVQVLPMDHGIDGQGQSRRADGARHDELLGMAVAIAADAIGDRGLRRLQAQLDMLEASLAQAGDAPLVEQHACGDQVGVEPQATRMCDDRLQIGACRGLATRQMDLQHAQAGRLVEHAAPFGRRQLARRSLQLERVGAVGALQRAAMGQFGQEPHRRLGPRIAATGQEISHDHPPR